MERFQAWTQRYLATPNADRPSLVKEGVRLAQERRAEFKSLITSNPREALRLAVPMVVRQELAEEVLAQLEERVAGRAQLRTYLSSPIPGSPSTQPPVLRMAEFESGQTYEAHVYGRRTTSVLWLPNAAINGVAIDGQLAVNESPLRRLEVGERPPTGKAAIEVCPVSGRTTLATPPSDPVEASTVAVEVYHEVVYLCDGSHVAFFEEQLIQGEGSTGGPQRFTGILPSRPSPSLGELRVLYIPMTFADQNQVPASETRSYDLMREVADFFYKSSFGRLSLQTTVSPPIRLPHDEAWYVQKDTSDGFSKEIDGLGLEHQHARDEAAKLGYDSNDFDAVVVRLTGGPRVTGGWGGGSSVWVYGDWANVVAHELGHCFGLAHSNFWDTGGASAIGSGANQEYGNLFDVMGGGPFPANHYASQAKNQVKWLPDNFVQTVTSSGVYRIHAFDQTLLDPAKRYALKIVKDTQRTYWAEVRAQFDSLNRWVANGLVLGWKWPLNSGSNFQLIDTTPQSPGGKNDAPVVVGQTFSDLEAGIHLTVLSVATDPNGERSAEVRVTLGKFPSNTPPSLALSASALNVPANAPVTFTAKATDSDGDPLAYQWLSSDNTTAASAVIGPNGASFTRSFASDGQYVVTCIASDGRGGRATRYVVVTVGNGNSRFSISGRVTLEGRGLPGVFVSTGTSNGVPTDSDGNFTIPNLAAGTYTVAPLLYGYSFIELFNNGVLVGPNFSGANFSADALATVSLVASVPAVTEGGTSTGKFTLVRTGPDADPLTVNLLPSSGSATLTTDYTLTPAPTAGSPYNTVVIPAGSSSLDILVSPVNDSLVEGPETVTLQLGLSPDYVIKGDPVATVTINDDDTALPRISISAETLAARENPLRTAAFTVSRTGANTSPLAINLTYGGTATAGSDYASLPSTLTIPAGSSSATLVVSPIDDTSAEDFESVVATLTASAAYLVDPGSASATILIEDDDQQVVSLEVTDPIATEVNLSLTGAVPDTAVFVATRSGDLSRPLTVQYALSGTALHGVDYEALPGSITFPAGIAQVSIVITPRYDSIGEGEETVALQLAAGGPAYRLGTVSSGVITIKDAGDPTSVDVITVANAAEPATAGKFRFSTRGFPNGVGSVAINYTVTGTATPGVDYTALPGLVTISSGAKAVAAGQYHSLVLRPDNSLWVSGYNNSGQLGDGTTTSRASLVPLAADVIATAAGYAHTLYATADGALWTTGLNTYGQLGDATTTNRTAPVRVLASGVTGLGAGIYHSLILKADGSLWGMGLNGNGQLGDGTTTNRSAPVQALASGVKAVAGGGYHSLVLKTDGSLWAMGQNTSGQLGDGTTTNRSTPVMVVAGGVAAIAAGQSHSLLLKTDGTLWAMGLNSSGQLGDGTTTNRNVPVVLATGIAAIAAGYNHSLFVKADGTLWATGANGDGQLGDGTATNRLTPVMVSQQIAAIGAGGRHSLVVETSGALRAMGYNNDGELGLGSTSSQQSPTLVTTYSIDVLVKPIDDATAEELETVTVAISPDTRYSTWEASRTATMWLLDDEQPTVFVDAHTTASSGLSTLAESSATPGKFYISRTGSTTAALTVNYTITGTATNGQDFVSLSGAATIPAGAPGVDVTVTPLQDTTFEGVETVILNLAPGAYSRGPSATIYLTDDETSTTTVAFTAASSVTAESAGTVNIPVTLSAAAAVPVTVDYTALATGTGAAGGYTATDTLPYWLRIARVGDVFTASRSADGITWTAFSTSTTLALSDPIWVGLAVCGVDGSPATAVFDNVTLTPDTGTALVGRDVGFVGTAGSLSVSGGTYTVSGAGTAISGSADSFYFAAKSVAGNFTLSTRVVSSTGTSSTRLAGLMVREDMRRTARNVLVAQSGTGAISYLRRFNSAMTAQGAGVDYRLAAGTLTFAPGVTSLSIPVTIINDQLPEPAEQIVLSLRNPAGAILGTNSQHVIAVTDDDVAPLQPSVGFASATSSVKEGATAALLVTLSQAAAATVSVDYAVSGGSATAGADFTLSSGTLTFAAGEITKTISLPTADDSVVEPTETVFVTLLRPTGATITTLSTHTVSILDNDLPVVTAFASDADAAEDGNTGAWTFSRTGTTTSPLTVNFSVGGTAISGVDYAPVGTSITIPAGATSATLLLTPLSDAQAETAETVALSLTASPNYLIGSTATATITIADTNTPVVSVVATAPDASETGLAPGVFTVSRTGPTTNALTVSFTVTGTATSGSDYLALGTSVTIPAGQSATTLTVTPIDDTLTEGPEYVVLSLSAGSSYSLSSSYYATVTIADNDQPPTVVIVQPAAKSVQLANGVGLMLESSATDDGAPSALVYSWTKLSGAGTVTFGSADKAATTARFSDPGLYVVRVSVTDGQFTAADEMMVQVGGFAAANWVDLDLGAPSTRGSSAEVSGTFKVTGSGTGFGATTDSAHFVARQVAGTSSITARVTGFASGSSANALAGVMFRETSNRGSRRALLAVKSNGTVEWHTRSAVNGADTSTAGGSAAPLPVWLRIDRAGDVLTAFRASDVSGAPGNWTQVGTPLTLTTLANNVMVGLAASNSTSNTTVVATIDSVVLSPAPTGPAVVSEDLGTGIIAGSSTVGSTSTSLSGSGTLGDSGHFRFQQFTGDVTVTARIVSHTASGQSAKGGVMIRDASPDPTAFGMMGIAHYWGGYFTWRNVIGGAVGSNYGGDKSNPQWIRLVREGDLVTAWKAPNTATNQPGTWVKQGATQVFGAAAPIHVGLAVDAASATDLNTVVLDNLSIVPGNLAPVVATGPGGTVTGNSVSLHATASDDGAPNPPAAMATQWFKVSGPGAVTFANDRALDTTATFFAPGTYVLRITATDGEATTFAEAIYAVNGQPPPVITQQPLAAQIGSSDSYALTVTASGTGPVTYQWRKNGAAITSATNATYTIGSAQAADAGYYDVVIGDGVSAPVTSNAALVRVVPAGTAAMHEVVGGGYTVLPSVTIKNSISFAGSAASLRWQVLLPEGWSFVSDNAGTLQSRPAVGSTGLLEWNWASPPASPIIFSYVLAKPATAQSADFQLSALAIIRLDSAAWTFDLLAKPEPLRLRSVTLHSADTDRDFQISLYELTRVIEIFNTRNGTVRTGAYTLSSGSEDGFAADPTRGNKSTSALQYYHSADTNMDARISVTELTRVIELYNTRSGNTRTGSYRAVLSPETATEDGYSPNP